MPTSQEIAVTWNKRITAATSYYNEWADSFKVRKLEEAYYGKQWDLAFFPAGYEPYVLNLVYSTIEVQLPSRLFTLPIYAVKPKPSKMDFDIESSSAKARLKQDILNFFAQDIEFGLGFEAELGIVDAYFRFGIIHVGYSVDWITNPNAGKPMLAKDYDEGLEEGGILREPDLIPENERIFAKRVPADRFRVGGIDHQNLKKCSWCGYWEFARVEDIRANPNFNQKAKDNLGAGTNRTGDFVKEALSAELDELLKQGDLIPIWYLWDQRSKKFNIHADGADDLLFEQDYKRLPVFALKYSEKLRGFYPLPPVYNWMGPQKEYNDSRESLRVHRRRFVRKYIVRKEAFDVGEKEKFEYGADGHIGEVNIPINEAIKAVDAPSVGADVGNSVVVAKDDFFIISGASAAQRGTTDRTTATESGIIEKRATIRETRPREQIAKWLNAIGKEILELAREKLSLPFWIKVSADNPQDIGEITQIQEIWKQINPLEVLVDDEDFEVNISVSSLSPVTNEEEKQRFIEFLTIITNFPAISMSPTLVRETAERVGYRNEKVIAEMQKMAMYVHLGQMAQAQQSLKAVGMDAGGGNAIAEQKVEQLTPPDQEEIRQQLEGSVVQ